MRLYVGNLSYDTNDASLSTAFSAFGAVEEAAVIQDRDTGRSKGFGFVTMASEEEGAAAMAGLDGHDIDGRAIRVNEARPMEKRSNGGGFGGSRW